MKKSLALIALLSLGLAGCGQTALNAPIAEKTASLAARAKAADFSGFELQKGFPKSFVGGMYMLEMANAKGDTLVMMLSVYNGNQVADFSITRFKSGVGTGEALVDNSALAKGFGKADAKALADHLRKPYTMTEVQGQMMGLFIGALEMITR